MMSAWMSTWRTSDGDEPGKEGEVRPRVVEAEWQQHRGNGKGDDGDDDGDEAS